MIHIEVDNSADTLHETLKIPEDRAKWIAKAVRERERPPYETVSDTMKWICFTEELNNMNERVLALYVLGGDGYRNAMQQEAEDKIRKLKDILGGDDEDSNDC
jgi:hypothetical protein